MSVPLRVLVVDDEAIARKRAVRLLEALEGIDVAGECESGEELLTRLEADDIDIVLLDIQMPGLTGLDAKSLMPADGPYVIFATAHAQHAVEAFDVGADDYLLKPIDAARLRKAIDRARQRHLERPRADLEAPRARTELRETRLPVTTREGVVLLIPSDISHAIWDGQLVTIHAAGRALLTDMSLQDLAARLPSDMFERVHRRALLNLDHVSLLEPCPSGGYIARTTRGDGVEVSRQAARRLRRRLGIA